MRLAEARRDDLKSATLPRFEWMLLDNLRADLPPECATDALAVRLADIFGINAVHLTPCPAASTW